MKRYEMLIAKYSDGLNKMAATGSCGAMDCIVCPFKEERGLCASETSKDRRMGLLNQEVEV